MDAQADLGLHCPHMPKDSFLHGADQMILSLHKPKEVKQATILEKGTGNNCCVLLCNKLFL